MDRIAIIGSGGSGKSVLARRLGDRLGVEAIHLDVLFWSPGWVEMPHDQWRLRQQELVAADHWVIDGNHAPTMEVRLSRADTVVFLDLPRWLCLWRIVKRSVVYRHRPRVDRAEGCDERLNREFVRWVWTFPQRDRQRALEAVAGHAGEATLIHLRSRREVERFVNSITPDR